jgi:RNA polymerase sigma factor (sigma-70 family)
VTYALGTANFRSHGNENSTTEPLPAFRRRDGARSNLLKNARNRASNPVASSEEALRREALEEMFVASRGKYLAMANSILRNREDAEDAVQEGFLSAHRHLRNFEGRSALSTWLARIVLNAALMMRRKRSPGAAKPLFESGVAQDDEWMVSIPDPQPNPEMAYARIEKRQILDGVLGKLKPVLRQAFTLTFEEDLAGDEASARLGVSTGTFKGRLFRAKRQVFQQTRRRLVKPIYTKPHRRLNILTQ